MWCPKREEREPCKTQKHRQKLLITPRHQSSIVALAYSWGLLSQKRRNGFCIFLETAHCGNRSCHPQNVREGQGSGELLDEVTWPWSWKVGGTAPMRSPACRGTRMTAPGSSMPSDTEPGEAWLCRDWGLAPRAPELDNWTVHSWATLGCCSDSGFAGCHFFQLFPFRSPYLSFCFHPRLTQKDEAEYRDRPTLTSSSQLTDSFLLIQPLIRHHLLAPNCMWILCQAPLYATQILE